MTLAARADQSSNTGVDLGHIDQTFWHVHHSAGRATFSPDPFNRPQPGRPGQSHRDHRDRAYQPGLLVFPRNPRETFAIDQRLPDGSC